MATIGEIRFENDAPLAIIAGPCMIEEEERALATARRLKEIAARLGVGLVFKASYDKANRQSLASARGVGMVPGLAILKRIREELGLAILTDIHDVSEAEAVGEVVDCVQIPAFLCRQTDLVVAAARTGRTVNIKKGQFLAPPQMRSIVEKARAAGARDVLVTERGASFGYNDLIFDPRSLAIMKDFATVLFDASHSVQKPGASGNASGGERHFIPPLARAAAAVGVAGLYLETHPDPAAALSDRETQWPLDDFETLLAPILAVDRAVK